MKDHAAILIRKNNEFLFIKRSKNKSTLPNLWAFPSGTKEDSEDIYETVVRESMEELGVEVKVESTLTTKELTEFNVKLYFIICSIVKGDPKIKSAFSTPVFRSGLH